MDDRIAALKELAQRAVPGKWQQSHRKKWDGMWDTQVYCDKGETIATIAWYPRPEGQGVTGTYRSDNAAFIAACDPSTILKLVAVVEKARQAQSSLTVAVESDLGEAWLNPQTARDQWLRDAREALASLRSALSALDDREPA